MMIGTTNFAAIYLIFRKKIKSFFKIGEIRFGIFLLLVSPFLMTVFLLAISGGFFAALRVSAFETISAISTTGFSTTVYTAWPDNAVFLMIVLMIIGGRTGSTAGGIKQYRVYLLIKSLWWNFKEYTLPKRIITRHKIQKPDGVEYIQKKAFIQTVNFMVLYILVYIVGVLILSLNGFSIKEAMFEYASCLSTIGLSIGVTSPDLNNYVLWTQIIGMFLGRLEFLIVFLSFIKIFHDVKTSSKLSKPKSNSVT